MYTIEFMVVVHYTKSIEKRLYTGKLIEEDVLILFLFFTYNENNLKFEIPTLQNSLSGSICRRRGNNRPDDLNQKYNFKRFTTLMFVCSIVLSWP